MTRLLIKQIALAAAFVACLFLAQTWAQDQRDLFYAESFRQGATQVKEQSFEAKLDSQSGIYRERIKDSRGNDRYALTIVPQGPEGDDKITSWQVKLADLHHTIYDNSNTVKSRCHASRLRREIKVVTT